MNTKGQLISIEFHYFMGGFILGIIGALALTWMGTKGILSFRIPGVCAMPGLLFRRKPFLGNLGKKAQLGIIEFKFFIIGLLVGLLVGFVLIGLGNAGVLPFKIPFVCPPPAK